MMISPRASFLLTVALVAAAGAVPAAPEPLELVAVLHDEEALARVHDIEVRDGIAYVAGKGGSLAIVEVKRPTAPRVLWSVRDRKAYEDAETVLPMGGHRLIVGSRDAFLFDVSQPAQPSLLARLVDRPRVDIINGLVRLGDVVFGANKQGYLFALEVSAADSLTLLGARNTRELDGLGSPHDVALYDAGGGDLLVVVSPEGFGRNSQPGKLGVYRVSDPLTRRVLPAEQWTLVGRIEHKLLAGANRVMTRGRFAYIGGSLALNTPRTDDLRNTVSIIDLTAPARPRLRGSVEFPDTRGPNGLDVAGDVVFAAGGQTVQAIDVSNPDAPREIAHATLPAAFPGGADDAHDLVYQDGHLFVTAQNSHSLVILRVQDDRIRDATRR